MFSAWSLWSSPIQKPSATATAPFGRLSQVSWMVLAIGSATAFAQQPVPIPSFDAPAATANTPAPAVTAAPATKAAPASTPIPATQPPATGTVVIIPNAPGDATPAFQQPPAKAQVKLDASGLSIHARNSSLSQILRDVSSASGMKVEGLSRDERVFGNFGPDQPQLVLSALLDGSGYNVIMVGATDRSTPKVLSLSPRNQQPAQPGQVEIAPEATPVIGPNGDEEGDQMTDDPSDVQPEPQIQVAPAPIPSTDAGPSSPEDAPSVRTPQQLLEELQRLHMQPDQNAPQQTAPAGNAPSDK